MSVLFDTSILIDVLRADQAALDYVNDVTEVPICSEVTRIAVCVALLSSERTSAEQLSGRSAGFRTTNRSHAAPANWAAAGTATGPASAWPTS